MMGGMIEGMQRSNAKQSKWLGGIVTSENGEGNHT